MLALSALLGVFSVDSLYAVCFGMILLLWLWKDKNRLMVFVSLTFLLFFSYTAFVNGTNFTSLKEGEVALNGKITSLPQIEGDSLSFEIKTVSENLKVQYYIATEKEKNELKLLQVGHTCSLTGSLKPPSHLRVPSLFDYERYLYHKKIHWIYVLNDKPSCESLSESFIIKIQQYRQHVMTDIALTYPSQIQGIAASLLVGDRSLLPTDVIEAYQELGLSHVLAVSGLHVSVIGGLIFWIVIRIGVTREKAYSTLFLFYPFYLIFTGGAPSVVRASLMAMAVVLSLRYQLKINPLDGIAVACLITLLVNPYYAYHIGFQLSFLIAFALIVSSQTILLRYQHPFTKLLALSILAQVISFPLVIYHFYQISFLSLGLNLIYVPFISIIVLPTLLLLFLLNHLSLTFLFTPVSELLATVITFIHQFFLFLSELNMNVVIGAMSEGGLILSLAICYSVALLWERGEIMKAGFIWLLYCGILYIVPYLSPSGEISFIDVGQGDSIVITLPFKQQVILIDTGGKPGFGEDEKWREKDSIFDTGRDIVLPYLKSKGIREVDLLILTHGDFDHAGGAAEVLEGIPIKKILLDQSKEQTEIEMNLLQTAREKKIPVTNAKEGQSWSVGEAQFTIIQALQTEEENDGSIIMQANVGGYRWLFTGDLEEEGERQLLYKKSLSQIDVLKVGHHGSATSSSKEFLETISPMLAVISVGENNRYGHPNEEVVNRYKELGISILRTDVYGTIRYTYKWNDTGKWSVMLNGK
ncbi:DNA internalization-related competence protein ComEC/Rec2 [Pseudalkalibacillus hwajinpoensis]|uniref:DNA internalization-related competence protein ComEC/Rec2 n=1 Tax=Guptibacillus hwajinpoensis TaxID=208199 RepID=UPI001CFE1E1A